MFLIYFILSLLPIFSVQGTEEKFIQANGAELFTKVMGSGNPLVVLHGGAGFLTHDYLLPHLEPLAENNLVVFYDQRGLGKSTGDITPEQINIKTYVEDIEAIRTSLGLKKISLLGHSWGAFLALHYAMAHPENLDQMILIGSMPISSNDLGLFFKELTERLAPYQEKLKQLESSQSYLSGDPTTVAEDQTITFQTYLYSPDNITKINLWRSQKAILNGFKVWDIFKEQIFMKPYDLTANLKTVQTPTLIIHGEEDVIPFVTAVHLHEAIPNSKLVKIEQSGHFSFVEQPETVFQAIHNFQNPSVGKRIAAPPYGENK